MRSSDAHTDIFEYVPRYFLQISRYFKALIPRYSCIHTRDYLRFGKVQTPKSYNFLLRSVRSFLVLHYYLHLQQNHSKLNSLTFFVIQSKIFCVNVTLSVASARTKQNLNCSMLIASKIQNKVPLQACRTYKIIKVILSYHSTIRWPYIQIENL